MGRMRLNEAPINPRICALVATALLLEMCVTCQTSDATPAKMMEQADQLRQEKLYLDALDYYQGGDEESSQAVLQNKTGITQLQQGL